MQAKSYFESFRKGDPDADAVAKAVQQQASEAGEPPQPPS
jgi:hypothetical protein